MATLVSLILDHLELDGRNIADQALFASFMQECLNWRNASKLLSV